MRVFEKPDVPAEDGRIAADVPVVPAFGRNAAFGTNPIPVAVPADRGRPFVLDMATGTVPVEGSCSWAGPESSSVATRGLAWRCGWMSFAGFSPARPVLIRSILGPRMAPFSLPDRSLIRRVDAFRPVDEFEVAVDLRAVAKELGVEYDLD